MPRLDPAPGANERRIGQALVDQSSTRPDIEIARIAAIDHSVLSLDELRACGLSRQAAALRARNGRLHRVHESVYAVGHPNLSVEGCFMAAVKACRPLAFLSHYAAAAHRGYVRWDHRMIEVTIPGDRRHVRPGLRIHRTEHLDPVDLARVGGIPVTSPARTLLDLAAVVDERVLRRAMNQAMSLNQVTVGELAEVLARLGPRRGSAKFADLVACGPAPTRSDLEDLVLALLLDGGRQRPDVNKPLWLSGRKVIPDFRWAEQRLVLEADGAAWHDNELAREDDAERQAFLEEHGETVIRVTWDQAVLRPGQSLQRAINAGAPPAER